MKIKSMKDLKTALQKIPDEVLEHFSVGMTDDGLGLSTDYTDRDVDEPDETHWMEYWQRMAKKYPELDLIELYFRRIIDIVHSDDLDDATEGIEVSIPKIK